MEKVDTLVVDKAGTLTQGRPAVTAIVLAEGRGEEEVLRLAAAVEQSSEHPLALAITDPVKQTTPEALRREGISVVSNAFRLNRQAL